MPQGQQWWDYNKRRPPEEENMLRLASTLGSRLRSRDSGGAGGNGKCSKGPGGGRKLRVTGDDVNGYPQNKCHDK